MRKIKKTVNISKHWIDMINKNHWDIDLFIESAIELNEHFRASSSFARTVFYLLDNPDYEITIRKK